MNHKKLFVTIAAMLAVMLAFAAVPADSEAGGSDAALSLSSADYDIEKNILRFSGTTTITGLFWFTVTDSNGDRVFEGHVVDEDISDGRFHSEAYMVLSDGEYRIKVFKGAMGSNLEDSMQFTVSSAKVSVDRTSISVTEGDSETVTVTVEKCDYSDLKVSSSDTSRISVGKIGNDGKLTITGLSACEGKVFIEIVKTGYTVSIDVEVKDKPLPPPPTEVKEFTFSLSMEMDWDKADWGSSGFSEDDLKTGITLTGSGTNAGEALEDACDNSRIPNEFISTHDGNDNDLRYWVVQIFGLGTVALEDGDWKYWVQEHDGNYNDKTLGWLTDNSGVYSLRYDITSVDYGNDVKSIYVKEQPTKTTYKVGESFDSTGMVVMADMSAGEDLQIYKYDVSPKTFTVAGDQNVTLTYRGESTTVAVTVTGGGDTPGPDVPPVDPDDKPLIDEETKTEVVENEDGSTTTTTTTTGKTEDGESVKVVDKVTDKDGVSTGTKTETVTDKDGNEIGNRVTESTKDKDGNTTSKTTATKTEKDGSKTSSTSESKLDKDGNGTTKSESVTTKTDGTSVSEKSTTERSEDKVTETKVTESKDADGKSTGKQTESKVQETLKDSEGNETGTLTAETKETVGKDGKSEKTEDVAVESKDGNVKTEATSKTDKDGNVKAETTTTVKSETKDVEADAIDAALKQSEQALSNISADKTEVTKTFEVEVANGTSAALSPEAVKKVSDYGAGLKVSVSEGSIDTDSDVLKNLAKDGKTIELSMEANNKDVLKDNQKDIVGDNHFVDLNALVGGENVHQLGGKAVITFSYQLKDGESAVDLKVFYVDDEGNKTLVDATFENGSFTMTVDHFSVYMVENVSASESDDSGISPVLIAGIVVIIIAAIVGIVLYTRKN